MKVRLKGAIKGHSLLKKKVDALKLRFHAILKKIIEVKFLFFYPLDFLSFLLQILHKNVCCQILKIMICC